jgi:predicted enzyme related to lactoylglutathione lyase
MPLNPDAFTGLCRSPSATLFAQSIPLAAFEVGGIEAEYARLKSLGVVFTREPARMGPVTIAVFSDTCGNLIQLYQPE